MRSHQKYRTQRLAGKRQQYADNKERWKAYGQRRYAEKNEQVRSEHRRYYLAHKEQARESNRRWMANNPDRAIISARAIRKVRTAIENGILTRRDTCEECGATGVKIEAAHADYSRPLDVRWLCVPCHRRWDYHEPKTL